MEKWAKEQADITGVDMKWDYRMAESFSFCGQSKETTLRYGKVVNSDLADWKCRLGLVRVNLNDHKTKDCISHLEEMLHLNRADINTSEDNDFKTEYWDNILYCLLMLANRTDSSAKPRKTSGRSRNKPSEERSICSPLRQRHGDLSTLTTDEETRAP